MRNKKQVYWVKCNEDNLWLLRGSKLLEIDYDGYVENNAEWLNAAWEDNAFMAQQGEEGVTLHKVTNEEANKLYAAQNCSEEYA